MKIWKTLVIINILFFNYAFASNKFLNKIVAIVNNDIILETDVNAMLCLEKLRLKKNKIIFSNKTNFRKIIIEKIIIDNLLLQTGKKFDIQIDNKKVDEVISNLALHNKQTVYQFRKNLINNGVNFNFYRKQLKNQIKILEIAKKIFYEKSSFIDQKEINSLYNYIINQVNNNIEINASHILLPISDVDTQKKIDEKKILANTLIKNIKNGISLVALKNKYSNVLNYSYSNDTKWSKINEFPSIFFDFLIVAKKNDIIGPILSKKGFHLLKINDVIGKNPNVLINKIHIRHILLKTSPHMNDTKVRQKLIQISNDIKNKKVEFSYVAKKISVDVASALNGGDLGWISAYNFDINLFNQLNKLKKNQISDPIRSSLGWHLIQILDRKQFDESKKIYTQQAYKLIFKRKFFNFFESWIQENKSNAYIKIFNFNNTKNNDQ